MDYELSEGFEVLVRMHKGFVLQHFLIAVVVDVVTGMSMEGGFCEQALESYP